MMTYEEALSFAKFSAIMAVDNIGSKDFTDPIESFRDNIRDTLQDEGCAELEEECWAIYDAQIVEELISLYWPKR